MRQQTDSDKTMDSITKLIWKIKGKSNNHLYQTASNFIFCAYVSVTRTTECRLKMHTVTLCVLESSCVSKGQGM